MNQSVGFASERHMSNRSARFTPKEQKITRLDRIQ
jgi:hypothetical protein